MAACRLSHLIFFQEVSGRADGFTVGPGIRLRLESEILIAVGRHCYSGRHPLPAQRGCAGSRGKEKNIYIYFSLFSFVMRQQKESIFIKGDIYVSSDKQKPCLGSTDRTDPPSASLHLGHQLQDSDHPSPSFQTPPPASPRCFCHGLFMHYASFLNNLPSHLSIFPPPPLLPFSSA